jgi:glycerophosphoryl diester phosphodiesterase
MRVIGHRGARFEAPENTVSGFRYAMGVGVDGFELDVHLTKDGHLAVIHDATVDRTTNGTGAVSDFTLAELQALDARSNFSDWPEPAIIPTLDEVLAVIGGMPWIEIEIKTDLPERLDKVVPQVIEAIHRFGLERTAFITSFDGYALELAMAHAPELRRGFICKYDKLDDLEEAQRLGASLIGFPYATGIPEIAIQAREAGMLRSGWPTNDRAALDQVFIHDLDGICTDSPTQINAWLAERVVTR